jgi:predicted RNA-binding protein YlxR (DUF448 family)
VTQDATLADEKDTMRERRCIVTGEVMSDAALIRFCVDPDGNVIPDIAAVLPGRGIWVGAERNRIDTAVAKGLFSKAAKTKVTASSDLAARTERLLAGRMLQDLGLARRSGTLVVGFDNVSREFETKMPPVVLVEASDGAEDGRRKISAVARARGLQLPVMDCFSSQELSLALGRENVIHAALKPGRLAERLIADAGRLQGLRPSSHQAPRSGRNERDE